MDYLSLIFRIICCSSYISTYYFICTPMLWNWFLSLNLMNQPLLALDFCTFLISLNLQKIEES